MDHGLKLSNVVKECGLSMKFITKINNNENIELKTLEKICLHLGISIQEVVEFIPD
jgi:DNA-binding Xre family transcriptional regulator